MKEELGALIVTNKKLQEITGKSAKAVVIMRHQIREKCGLSKRQLITDYHLAVFMDVPPEHLRPHLL
ncbi:MAG: hypothetical protein IE931_13480 [Sphingobacteriales bacterium]|nr:hypothetical protein [Sphingobacteriales bacterium]